MLKLPSFFSPAREAEGAQARDGMFRTCGSEGSARAECGHPHARKQGIRTCGTEPPERAGVRKGKPRGKAPAQADAPLRGGRYKASNKFQGHFTRRTLCSTRPSLSTIDSTSESFATEMTEKPVSPLQKTVPRTGFTLRESEAELFTT